jgi:hypothetical protein
MQQLNRWHQAMLSAAGVSAGAALLFVVACHYDIALINGPSCCIYVRGGELGIAYYLPSRKGQYASLSGLPRSMVRERTEPLCVRRARHEICISGDEIFYSHHLPIWMLVGTGLVSTILLKLRLRGARYSRQICIGCGYDLRGTPDGKCSECGLPVRKPFGVLMPGVAASSHRALVVYASIALLWSSCNAVVVGAPSLWWPDPHGCGSFLAQLCGPPAWLLAAFWPVLADTLPNGLVMGVFTAAVWSIWVVILSRSRLRNVSTSVHSVIAIAWFCLGNFVMALGVWAFS